VRYIVNVLTVRIVFLFTVIPFYFECDAQSGNPCGVKAIISPAVADSVVPPYTGVQFTSNSRNATSVKWLYNGMITESLDPTFYTSIYTGVNRISLVASNGNCSDTTTVVYFSAGTPYNLDSGFFANYGTDYNDEYATTIDDAPDGNFIFGGWGEVPRDGNLAHRGFVVKLRDKGCVEWSKILEGRNNGAYVKSIYAANDTNYYVSASDVQPVLFKLDKNGNTTWMKGWSIDGLYNFFLGNDKITGDSSGNIYTLSRVDYGSFAVTKLDSSGTILWNKFFQLIRNTNDYAVPIGILMLKGKLFISGACFTNNTSKAISFVMRLDALTGRKDWSYGYQQGDSYAPISFGHPSKYKDLVMVDGIASGGGQIVTLLDQDGNFRKGIKAVFNDKFEPLSTKAEADTNGNIYIMQWVNQTLNLAPYYRYYTNIVKIDTALNKLWGAVYGNYARGNFTDVAINNKNVFAAIGADYGLVGDGLLGSKNFQFMKVDKPTLNQNQLCSSTTLNYSLSTFDVNRVDLHWDTDSSLSFSPVPFNGIYLTDAYIKSRYNCPDFIDSCSLMAITGPKSGCNYSTPYTFHVHRNRKCSLVPDWKLPAHVSILNQTDSTITVKFPRFGTYTILCTLQSCLTVADSLVISIAPKISIPLNLGKDTTICKNTSIVLHAGDKFLSYQWQNGSTDSIFTVTQPGKYWVEVIDSCGSPLRDSITIRPYGNVTLSLGPDRTKCNNDTLHLNAPSGFLNYYWSNNYNISSLNTQTVVVNPLVDTAYYLKAEKVSGCFAYDTIHVLVHQSPPIDLGPDKKFCLGDSITFDAGNGFQSYLWNKGNNSQALIVKNEGTYSVIATTSEGCKSYDTVQVLQVFALPVVQLDKGYTLCNGDTKVLNAGSFASYRWQDGSTAQTFTVNGIGKYFVSVVDNNGCPGSDTTAITTILPQPKSFLPPDTAICSYGTLELKSTSSYRSYLWSDGSRAPSITITQSGIYWLQVQDNNNCTGKDSILVNPKQCLSGFYVPTAFTPNGDGKNDIFKPLLFGRVKKYQFTIYNRWGQVIYQTSNLQYGWDGKASGILLDTNVFAWSCTYQMEGENVKTEKGTVVLIK
jgi:gliding motility-associated-like protein